MSGGWDYRVIVEQSDDEERFTIREVYYDDQDEPHSTTAEPCWPAGESIETLTEEMRMMQRALTLPVLDMRRFEKDEEECK